MADIGFSTGCVYKSSYDNKPMDELLDFYLSLGTDIVELSFPTPEILEDFELTSVKQNIKRYKSVTVHAPWKNVRYNRGTEHVLEKLDYLHKELSSDGVVIHTDTVEDFSVLEPYFLIENMDARKDFGTHPDHFEELKEYGFGFVFDIQHAYENDPSMNLARDLLEAMGDRLKHLHVSGHIAAENHYVTYLSDNKEAVKEILMLVPDKPVILEGRFIDNVEQKAGVELEFIYTILYQG